VAVNNQIVIGWDMINVNKFLEEEYTRDDTVFLILRKMPKENAISLKQYRHEEELNNHRNKQLHKSNNLAEGESQQHQRKLSFSDIFLT
jgi:hypothetical protein